METTPLPISTKSKPGEHCSLDYSKTDNTLVVKLTGKPCPDATVQLKATGFRHHKLPGDWRAPFTKERDTFLLALQATLTKGGALPELEVQYPFKANAENISKKKFSLVRILVNGSNNPPVSENYLVFDPSKPVAEAIGELFARQQYGEAATEVTAHPRAFIPEARELLKAGRVIPQTITLKENSPETPPKKEPTKPVQPIQKESTQPTPSDEPEKVRESQAIGKPEGDYKQLLRSIRKEKASLKDILDKEQSARIFRKVTDLVPNLLRLIGKGHHFASSKPSEGSELFFEYLGAPKTGQHVISLSHYLPSLEGRLPNPIIEIRLFPGKRTGEVLSLQHPGGYRLVYINDHGRELVNPKERKHLNAFLDEWLTQLLQAGHQISLDTKQDPPDENWGLEDKKTDYKAWQISPLERMKNIRTDLEQMVADQKASQLSTAMPEMRSIVQKVRNMEKTLLNPEIFPTEDDD